MFKRVGLVGVGAMGQALLYRLNVAKVTVTAYDVSKVCMSEALKLGATAADSPAAVTLDAEAVHVFVRTDEEDIDATMGEKGVLSAMLPGTTLILHSTVFPETTRRIAEAAIARNVNVMDAPVAAVPHRVRDGEAVFLVGGSAECLLRARPHLEALGKAVYHFGPVGSGNVAKLAKNLSTAIDRIASAEVAWLAEAGGLDSRAFFEMMRAEESPSSFQRWRHVFTLENGHSVPRPATNLLNKDIGMAAEFAAANGLTARVTQAAAKTAEEWVLGWRRKK